MRILVVEDEGRLQTSFVERLTAKNIAVDYASDVNTAIKFARMMRYDAAVVDVRNGPAPCGDIQRGLSRMQPWMKVLVVTGRGACKGFMPAAGNEFLLNRLTRSLNGASTKSARCA